ERADDQHYRFPEGTVFFKTFTADERPIETRVMRLRDGQWDFAAYQWNEDATDAMRLTLDEPTPVQLTLDESDFDHIIPSRGQCRTCHEAGARRVLGYTPLSRRDGADIVAPDTDT